MSDSLVSVTMINAWRSSAPVSASCAAHPDELEELVDPAGSSIDVDGHVTRHAGQGVRTGDGKVTIACPAPPGRPGQSGHANRRSQRDRHDDR